MFSDCFSLFDYVLIIFNCIIRDNFISAHNCVSLFLDLELFLFHLQSVLVRVALDGEECYDKKTEENLKKSSKHVRHLMSYTWEWFKI